uniref:Glutamyl-tRNA reductase n=2 Tax=Steinernema glaseri TaxID=37863 RepID=A0A1I7ZKZ3_9BILA
MQNERLSGESESAEALQKRLDKMMALGERTRQQRVAIGAVEEVADRLVKTVAQTDAHERIALEQSQMLAEMKRRQKRLDDRVQRNVEELQKEMQKMDQMNVTAEQTRLKTDLENVVAETRELALQLSSQQPISADPQKLAEQLDAFEKLQQEVFAQEEAVMLTRAKVVDQLKRCPDGELREELEQELERLAAEWNPLMQGVKERKTLMEKVKTLADEMAIAQKEAKEAVEEDAKRLLEAKASAEDVEAEIENIAALQEALKKRKPQIEALKQLGTKLEMLAPGPDANRTCRAVENVSDDWERLQKDCKDAGRNAQRKNKLRLDFEKAVVEAEQLLAACRNHEIFAHCKNEEPEALANAILQAQGADDVLNKENVKTNCDSTSRRPW